MAEKMNLTDAEWRERLTPEQYAILRQKGTERAFTGEYEKNKAAGEYVCAACGQPLFESDDKFEAGSGWPSFVRPAEDGAVEEHRRSTRSTWRPARTRATGWFARRSSARAAKAIWAMCSRTARAIAEACAIASTALPSTSSRRKTDRRKPVCR